MVIVWTRFRGLHGSAHAAGDEQQRDETPGILLGSVVACRIGLYERCGASAVAASKHPRAA